MQNPGVGSACFSQARLGHRGGANSIVALLAGADTAPARAYVPRPSQRSQESPRPPSGHSVLAVGVLAGVGGLQVAEARARLVRRRRAAQGAQLGTGGRGHRVAQALLRRPVACETIGRLLDVAVHLAGADDEHVILALAPQAGPLGV